MRVGAAIAATNHYRNLREESTGGAPDMSDIPCIRYEALLSSLDGHSAPVQVGDDRLLYTLTDERIRQEVPAQHVIMRPAQNSIRLLVPRRLMSNGMSPTP